MAKPGCCSIAVRKFYNVRNKGAAMGNMLDAPNTEKDTDQGEVDLGGRVMYGACGMQGYRPEMEDQHTCATSIPGLDGHAFFAVYDGHGGDVAAILSEKMLLPAIQKQSQYIAYMKSPPNQRNPKMLGEAMEAGFIQCDAELRPKLSAGDTSGEPPPNSIWRWAAPCLALPRLPPPRGRRERTLTRLWVPGPLQGRP
eukprot:SAG22_NODE_3697_length_1570_cov_2.770224_1_plen_197_part_00